MTLKELAERLPVTWGRRKPGVEMMRESKTRMIARYPENARPRKGIDGIFVYADGFILYQHTDHACVLRIDECVKPYTYHSADGAGKTIPLERFMEMDWKVRIILTGEDRIAVNRSVANEEHEIPLSETGGMTARNYGSIKPLYDREFQKKVTSMLTEKQREVYILYYIQGYTAPEIGRLKGVSHRAVLFLFGCNKEKNI